MSPADVSEILRSLGRLEAKVDGLDAKVDATNSTVAENLVQAKLTNGRVTALEKWQVQVEEHEHTLAVVAEEQEEAEVDAAAHRDRKLTRRDNLRNILLGALLTLLTGIAVALIADLHLFSGG